MYKDEKPLTKVRYKKNRPAGIPVLFTLLDHERTFWKVKYKSSASKTVEVVLETILSHTINKDVRVARLDAANKHPKLSTLPSVKISVKVPTRTRVISQK